ncbi:Sec translocon accessory complex subunit YajC [uncultured Gammaproteobacteria bacterium]
MADGLLISTALAQTAAPGAGGAGDLMSLLPMVLIFFVIYFLVLRPQQKKAKEHKDMLDALRRGDRVVTGGGIIAKVIKVGPEDEAMLEIAEGVHVKVVKSTINLVMGKTEPVRANDSESDSGKPSLVKK